ncbi:MAG: LysM domain-containing protein, partial [Acidobacteria bacterium]|nr:LysM domain-containing protein [Acidobacteriota bacterium]
TPWRIIRDNRLFWDERLTPGTVLRVRPEQPRATTVTHQVVRGDTLNSLARRYGTTVRAIQDANAMGRRTVIRIGQRLQIPTR